MPTLKIDGQPVEVEDGQTVLDAANALGIEIPTLCYHRAVPSAGACRICVVEIKAGGRPGLVPACSYPAQDGLEIETGSERVLESRRMTLGLLRARAPDAEVIQEMAEQYGVEPLPFESPPPHGRDGDGAQGDEKAAEPCAANRCIMCGLCVRVCREVIGPEATCFAGRGIEREISTPYKLLSDVCIGCGACALVCPTGAIDPAEFCSHPLEKIPDEFNANLGSRTPIYIPFPQAVPLVPVIDTDNCIHFRTEGCGACKDICPADAIDYDMKDKEQELHAGAVVLTSGYDVFDARRKSEYGFGRYPNVVTSMQFERILSASGPYEGHVQRPSDGKTPRKVAWIQCVGSRDVTLGNDYCSSVCCMYATKEAIIAKEHEGDIEPTIFFIDMRAFGKGFEGFYNRAKEDYGVQYVRSQVSSLKENPENQNIIVRYVQESNGRKRVAEEEFELVVLSVGLVSSPSTKELAEITGVACNRFGFAEGRAFLPALSSKEGVFLCGALSGPKDIPDTVMESSAAAALCGELLHSVRGTEVQVKEYPVEKDVAGQAPRIGVFVCHCGSNIASVVDVAAVADYIGSIPGVVYAEHTIYTCSQDTQERIKEVIREKDLNRVIVASCTPRTHEPLFQETMREAGLNKYLFEMADIREQCSWVHQREHDRATDKAKALVRGSVGKSRLLEPLQLKHVSITKAALVLGGGIAGMSASLSLAKQGFQVHLVEKSERLGGNLHHVSKSLEGYDWQAHLQQTIHQTESNDAITVYLDSEIDEVDGFVGNFSTRLKGASQAEIEHGVILIATGAEEFQPDKFLFTESDRVVTQRELEAKLENGFTADTVVMIQCVGSRDDEHPYCSRLCCGAAVRNALTIKEKNTEAKVYVLYRDIRTYQFKEQYYREAREKGVMFIHFPDEEYPEVSQNGGALSVTVHDTVLDESLELKPDLVVLSAAIVPDKDNNNRLAELMKVALTEDSFFMEAHVKLRPVDFATEGIFVCGLAHSPKYTEENITQALAAAGRAACILSKDSLEVGGVVSQVDQDKCAACLTCVRECVYNAPFVNADGKAEIEEAKCQGCGNCAAACPAKAIQLRTFTDTQERALFHCILHEDEVASDHMVLVEK